MQEIEIREVSAEETRLLRSAILRPQQPNEESIYPKDDAPDTLHLGAYLNGELVGVASVYNEPPPSETNGDAWRLRGMAIRTDVQRRGCGRALLERCIDDVRARGATRLWCNARTTAVGFYQALGFSVQGEEFARDGYPHVMMLRKTGPPAA
ncbi:MAG: GNAT family N-acetyltransferase [Pyrinomonadaceae bacterium]|jgi:predicted GNAT family N-acyltransferase|nr:GNAT family N-acetyltransferase [Pyrinomonadaceae bacterium]